MIINQKGQAAIMIVFVLGMVAILIGLSQVKLGTLESFRGRGTAGSLQAYYAANSGIEDAIHRIENGSSVTSPLTVNGNPVTITVTNTGIDTKNVKSVAKNGKYIRRIEANIKNTSVNPGFVYAIHAGANGFELENNTKITGKGNTDGNVFSNGYIKGLSSDHNNNGQKDCKTSASWISGQTTALGEISDLSGSNGNNSGVCITKDTIATSFLNCYIKGNPSGPNSLAAKCTANGSYTVAPSPTPVPLPAISVTPPSNTFAGDCIADLSGDPTDCTNGNDHMGNITIDGNLTINISNGKTLYFSGPVYVKKNLTITANSVMSVDPAGTSGQIIYVLGKINSASNVVFGSSGNLYLLFVSEYLPSPLPADLCGSNGANAAITLSQNTNSVLFYGKKACVYVTSNSTFHGAILGEKIHVSTNSTVEFDPNLKNAIFSTAAGGGWQVTSFKEF